MLFSPLLWTILILFFTSILTVGERGGQGHVEADGEEGQEEVVEDAGAAEAALHRGVHK